MDKQSSKFIFSQLIIISLIISILEQITFYVGTLQNHSFLFMVITFFAKLPIWILSFGVYYVCLQKVQNIKIHFLLKIIILSLIIIGFAFYIFIIFISWGYYLKSGIFISKELLKFSISNFYQLQLHLLQTAKLPYLLISATSLLISIFVSYRIINKKSFDFIGNGFIKIIGAFGIIAALFLLIGWYPVLIQETHPLYTYLFPYQERPVYADKKNSLRQITAQLQKKKLPDYSIYSVKVPVIVLMIESMRSDIITFEPCPVPFMKRMIKNSIYFAKPYATASHSDYADISVWYSQYPLRKLRRTGYKRDDPWRGYSIFKVFKELGYKTAYISSQNEKWGDMINWLKLPEVDYFYDSEDYQDETWYNEYDTQGIQRLIKNKIATAGKIEDTATFNVAKNWINSLDSNEKFFVGMNLQNSHFNYIIPKGGPEPFQPSVIDFPTPFMFWPKEKLEHIRNRYLNAFYNIDLLVRDFVDFLQRKGIWEKCIFVIIGDSGEAFYEHGVGNHGGEMFDEVMKTYCVVKPAEGVSPRTISHPISHIDIMPTVLDLMGVPQPTTFQGKSALTSPPRENVFLYSNGIVVQLGVVQWPWKFLLGIYPKGRKLFDLVNDPEEKNNLSESAEHQPVVRKMKLILDQWTQYQLEFYRSDFLYTKYAPPYL